MGLRNLFLLNRFILLACMTAFGCVPQQKNSPAAPAFPSSSLFATLSYLESDPARTFPQIQATIQNKGTQKEKINLFILNSPILSLEIEDNSGNKVRTPPPPVPPVSMDPYLKWLSPGETLIVIYHLHIFSPEFNKPYLIRMRDMDSNELKWNPARQRAQGSD
jgi:hypothetical protein